MNKHLINFTVPENKRDLLRHLGANEKLFDKSTQEGSFKKHKLQKKNKNSLDKFRIVWSIKSEDLSDLYKAFSRRFDDFLGWKLTEYPHRCAYGYVKGRNTIDNALCKV